MPFPFSEMCTLLSRLEDIELHDPPILIPAEKSARVKDITESWFRSHRRQLNELNVEQAVALLSTLLPERRTDRVYGMQSTRLCRILCRSLNLGFEHRKDLEAYKQPGRGDLASCLERILRSGGPPATPVVDLMHVDEMLDTLAGNCRFSDPKTGLPSSSSEERDQLIGTLLKRLDPPQSKWLVRLILKDFSTVRVNEALVLKSFHFLLSDLLRFQDDLTAAIQLLKGSLKEYPDSPDPRSRKLHRKRAAELLEPAVGTKVGRPTFYKARGIDNCMSLCGSGRWVLERKYDGEYCEIHIDLNRSPAVSECIKIFSKSGRDSTLDRKDLLPTLIESLHLGKPESKIRERAILLGELVVFSNQDRCILPFEKVRKYVTRSGIFLGTDDDSQPYAHEHVAIVFFDLLLLDDEIVMRRPLEQRRMWLREVYVKVDGKAMGAEWKIVDFGKAACARKTLIQQFAASIAARHEGLVLKPCDQPYFNLEASPMNSYIKLKKDYISGMGDEANFAVIGGSYSSQQALKSDIANLKWTEFHLGCLLNKVDVLRFGARPLFKLVGTIDFEHCIPAPISRAANTIGNFCAIPYNPAGLPTPFDIENTQAVKMSTIFSEPFVFEVLGSGFDKPSNCSFFMLRHPRVKKLHQDRTWKDCISFKELQEQAVAARSAPADSESQETKRMIARLEAKCKKKIERQRTNTPTSAGSTKSKTSGGASVSPRKRQQCHTATGKAPNSMRSALDGTTLVNTSSRRSKRTAEVLEDTPCPTSKRSKMDKSTKNAGEPSKSMTRTIISGRNSAPLADITSFASNQSSPPRAAESTECATPHEPTAAERTRQRQPSISMAAKQTSQRYSCETHHCTTTSCHLSNSVVFATACISSTPYITQDLLSIHDIISIPALEHWDRDSSAHQPLTETVSESQAFAGMRKIVLVEARRRQAVKAAVQQILALNKGKWRERAEVWDWRILEECAGHCVGFEDDGALRRKHFLGATMFDEGKDVALFVESGS